MECAMRILFELPMKLVTDTGDTVVFRIIWNYLPHIFKWGEEFIERKSKYICVFIEYLLQSDEK